ncbi:MAG: hypothetical protein JSS72_05540 [Armatimonadetes bacterium]|nr:hypothetical protein [Armatimonadota bacterium]
MLTLALNTILALAPASIHQSAPTDWAHGERDATIRSKAYHYTATAGYMPLTDDKGEVEAKIFFTAYTMPSDPNRPVTFVWNGGPGSSSLLMHMFNVGPRKLKPVDEKQSAYEIVDNDNSLLPTTDLVCMDPVGTGFSKAVKGDGKDYWSVEGDQEATRKFIQKYLELTGRQNAPVFLDGESYGTFRASGIAYSLLQRKVNLKGLVLVSNALSYEPFAGGNGFSDIYYLGYVPSYTAAAAFHHKLKAEWNNNPQAAIEESVRFTKNEYAAALEKGDELSSAERDVIANKLSELTSIDVATIKESNLRLDPDQFRNTLMKETHKSLDVYNSSLLGFYNPSPPPAVKRFEQYLKEEIGFNPGAEHYIGLSFAVNSKWQYPSALGGYPQVMDKLRIALTKYPALRAFVAQGKYDFATAFYGSERSLNHLNLPEKVRGHWKLKVYEGGHMMYLVPESHVQLHDDVEQFMNSLK